MIGAIIGDVVGSRFEFNNIKTKDFELVTEDSRFTDDTVLTIAVMDWVCNAKTTTEEEAAYFLQKWAKRYPNAGYGGRFYYWKDERYPKPYNSCGNGSAMRISAVGWLFDNEEELKKACKLITGVTHNHREGLKGAEVTAMMIYKARNGASMDELREYAVSMYPEINNLDYEELRRTYVHGAEICQVTLPQALYCFLISKDFEDCLRTTISIGGDCDTTSAISCAIAEAYYGSISEELKNKVLAKLPQDMRNVIARGEVRRKSK